MGDTKDMAMMGLIAVGGLFAIKMLGGKGGLFGAATTLSKAAETAGQAAETVGTGAAAIVAAPYNFGFGIGEFLANLLNPQKYPDDVVKKNQEDDAQNKKKIDEIKSKPAGIEKLELYREYLISRFEQAGQQLRDGIIDMPTLTQVQDEITERLNKVNNDLLNMNLQLAITEAQTRIEAENVAPAPAPPTMHDWYMERVPVVPTPSPPAAPYVPPPVPAPTQDIPPVNSPGYWTHLATTPAGNPAMQSYYEQQARTFENYQS